MTRLRCCVPFCNRTRRNDQGFGEWICADHWRLVPKDRRRVWLRIGRRITRATSANPMVREPWKFPAGSSDRLSAVRLWRLHDRLWAAIKRIAIERAGGI